MKTCAWAACGLLLLAVAGCNSSSTGVDMKWSDPTTITYYSLLHVNLARMSRTASGVFWWDSIPGTGTVPVKTGDALSVTYKLWLPDGTLEDSGSHFPLAALDTAHVIPGWVDGLQGAVQGTTRQLVIPPARGYPNGYGSIPPQTTLIFLVSVDTVTSPSSSVVANRQR